jgi:hypothetical protein
MAGTRLRPDDDIRRVRNVWLGPTGMTWPVQATYTAWGLFVCTLVGQLLFEAISPMKVSIFPAWEVMISMLLATAISGLIDHDKPLSMLPRVARQHLTSPRRRSTRTHIYKPTLRVRVRNRESIR